MASWDRRDRERHQAPVAAVRPPDCIRVNAVSPGVIKTPMHGPETHKFLAKLHLVGRMGEVRDIVDAVLYLGGAGFVAGEILHVDGGQSAGR